MFLDFRILVGMSDILECTKEFERRILKEERMSERAKTRSLLQRRPLSSLSGAPLVTFLRCRRKVTPIAARNEHIASLSFQVGLFARKIQSYPQEKVLKNLLTMVKKSVIITLLVKSLPNNSEIIL